MTKISSEADKLLKALFDYARRRRDEGVNDFTQIMHESPLLKQKEQIHQAIEKATPEKVQEIFRVLDICNS